MRKYNRLISMCRTAYLLCGVVATMGSAKAVEQGAYTPAAMDGFVKVQEYDADGNEDGTRETRIRRYRNLDGDKVFDMVTQGKLWAWSLDSYGDDDTDLEKNYVIRDSNCDGEFDERYTIDAEFKVPPCLLVMSK